MELTIKVNPTERTVRFREVHALAAGDAYSSVTLSGVTGAQTAALQLKLFKDSSASTVLAQCSSFAEVPGHPSERRGAMTLATQALKDWYESIVNDATATDTNGMPSALVNAWLVISDSVKTWAACQVPLILRAMDTNVVQGADGISPTVTLTKSGHVLAISVTDVNGTHTETVNDGEDGPPGVSPTVVVDVNPATGNVRVTAVNADGSSMTREVDVSGKAEKSEMSVTAGADATKKTIQLKSGLSQEVLVAHQDVSGKAEKSEMTVTAGADATKKVVQLKSGLSQTVLVEHQDISGKLDGAAAYPAWRAESYAEGAVVWHAGRAWVALNYATPDDEPGPDNSTWAGDGSTLYDRVEATGNTLAGKRGLKDLAVYGDAWVLTLEGVSESIPLVLTDGFPTETWTDTGVASTATYVMMRLGQTVWRLSSAPSAGGIEAMARDVPQDATEVVFVSGADNVTVVARASSVTQRVEGDSLAKTSMVATKQDALSASQLANIAAVPGKADAADLRYRIAEAGYATTGARLPEGATVRENGEVVSYEIERFSLPPTDMVYWRMVIAGAVVFSWKENGTNGADGSSGTYKFYDANGDELQTIPNLLVPYALADRAITAIPDGVSSVRLVFPPAVEGRARDFKVLIPGSPRVEFAGPGAVVGRSGSATPQFVEYVEATGTQWIDTGVVGRVGTHVTAKFTHNAGMTSFPVLVGAFRSNIGRFNLVGFYNQALDMQYADKYGFAIDEWGYVPFGGTYSVDSGITAAGVWNAASYAADGSVIRSKTVDVSSYGLVNTGLTMGVFADNTDYGPLDFSRDRLYWLKIWQDGILVRDFRPCAVDGGGALYDAVSGSVFKSKTDPLSAGPAVSGESAIYSFTEVRSGVLFCRVDHFKEVQ